MRSKEGRLMGNTKKNDYKLKVLGINTDFATSGCAWLEEDTIDTRISFLDYDAVIINTNYLSRFYKQAASKTYENKRLLSMSDSSAIVQDFQSVKDQLIELLKQGKNVFVLIGSNEDCVIYTGDTQYSGTGKNARITNIVRDFDTDSFLPINFQATYVAGTNYQILGNTVFNEFFKNTDGFFSYCAYFPKVDMVPLLVVPNTDNCISAMKKVFNGSIILLPQPFNSYDFDDEKEWKKECKHYLNELYKLIERLNEPDDEYILPQWTNDFYILTEEKENKQLAEDSKKLERLKKKVAKDEEKLKSTKYYKTLLTSTGTQLETIVKKVLSEMGFDLMPTIPGRDDIIAKFNDQDIVAEIKGVVRSATEKHASQLEKWVSLFMEDHDTHPKPLLIVNAFKDTPLSERTEDVFPDQMLKYSNAREHTLVSTTQLLCLYIDIKTNPDKKETLIKELLSTIGVYNRYTNISDYLQPIEKDED